MWLSASGSVLPCGCFETSRTCTLSAEFVPFFLRKGSTLLLHWCAWAGGVFFSVLVLRLRFDENDIKESWAPKPSQFYESFATFFFFEPSLCDAACRSPCSCIFDESLVKLLYSDFSHIARRWKFLWDYFMMPYKTSVAWCFVKRLDFEIWKVELQTRINKFQPFVEWMNELHIIHSTNAWKYTGFV